MNAKWHTMFALTTGLTWFFSRCRSTSLMFLGRDLGHGVMFPLGGRRQLS